MLSRIFKIFKFLALFIFITRAAFADNSALLNFLSELNLDKPVINNLLKDLEMQDYNKDRAAMARDAKGGAYYLAVVPVRLHKARDVQSELNIAAQNRALFISRTRLALALGQGKVLSNLYLYSEALAPALYTYYAPRGIEAKAGLIELNSKKFAVALARILPENAAALSDDVPPAEILNAEYSRELYFNHAKQIFNAGRYKDALPLFKNLHDLKFMNISAYLDAAECFLKTGEPNECLKLINELRAELEDAMSSRELERAGVLCREAGDRDAALSAFNKARVRFHEELAR